MSEPTLPEKCQICPVRSQRTPFCWKDLDLRQFMLGEASRVRRLRRRALLYQQGDEVTGWWIVRSGRVLEYMVDAQGREQIIRLAAAGSVVGICGLGPWAYHWTSARAGQSGAEVYYIPRERSRRLMAEYPELSQCLLAGMTEELHRAYLKLHGLVSLPARAATARLLLSVAETAPQGERVVTLTRGELANMLGVSRETVVRILSEFRAQGLIRDQGRGQIELVDTCQIHAAAEGIAPKALLPD